MRAFHGKVYNITYTRHITFDNGIKIKKTQKGSRDIRELCIFGYNRCHFKANIPTGMFGFMRVTGLEPTTFRVAEVGKLHAVKSALI